MKNLLSQIKQNLETNKVEVKDKDFVYFHLDKLYRVAQRCNDRKKSCKICKDSLHTISNISATYPKAINGTLSDRKGLEVEIMKIENHLAKKHQIRPWRYYTSLYSVLGILIGIGLGLLIWLLFQEISTKYFLAAGFTLGLIVGQVLGSRKDWKNRRNDRFF